MARKPVGGPRLDPASPILVLHGKEAFLRADYTRTLRERLAQTRGEIETLYFDGTRDALADVLDECRSFGLMQQHKLVAVDNADQLIKGDGRPLIERYAQAPVENATLVLRCDTWHRGNLDKLIEQAGGEIVKCEDLPPHAALGWATDRASRQHGVTLDRAAGELLVERIGGDLGRLDAELGKLAAASNGKAITRELVGELVGMTREEEAWSIQAMMLSRNPEAMLRQLRTILDNSKQDQTVLTFFAAMDLCRKLHLATEGLRQGMTPDTLARSLKLWGPSREAVLSAARRLTPETTSALLTMSVEADRRSKSGLGRADRLLERVALAIGSRAGH
ncbi:MAG: DNA polymerase III subunit delta [Phycisphaerales bacterium]